MPWCVALSLLILFASLQCGSLIVPAADVEVSIASFFSCTWFGSPEDFFPMAAPVYFNISLVNHCLDTKNVTIDISVLDCTNVPIGLEQLDQTLLPKETSHYLMSVFIPKHARLGIATAYASVFLSGRLVDTATTRFRIDPPDIVPPVVTLLSPENATYGSSMVPLIVTVDERPFWAEYSLDGQANVTISGNLTLTGLVNGQHSLTAYASDVSGNAGFSEVCFTVLIVHDVAATDLSCTPPEVFPGQVVSISVSVQNEGTGAETFNVSVLVNSVTLETFTVVELPAGNATELHLAWNTTGITKGNYAITSLAHPVSGEIDTADNTFPDRIVTVITRPDIAVTNVTNSKTVVGEGYPVLVIPTLMNQGDRTETFNVSIYANADLVRTESVALAGWTSTVTALSWIPLNSSKGYYTFTVVAWPVLNEVDIADNTFAGGSIFVTIPGDINGDRSVNIFDVVLIGASYTASQAGHPPSNPNCDIDGDGDVDLFDFVSAAGYYSEKW